MPIEPEELSSVSTLSQLAERIADCQRCSLGKTRTNLVFGVGNAESDLMFVGEAPGYHEDRQGEPFVGAAGKLLDELVLTILGMTRKDVYIGNVLKCRPPENRDPLPEEIASCRPYIMRQIELINPQVICCLGNFSTRLILNRNIYISKVHGQPIALGSRWVFPTYHPAAALYMTTTKQSLVEDFKKLADLMIDAPKMGLAAAEVAEESQAEQLGLF